MTNHQWTENTKPDRPGIWLRKDISGSMHTINIYANQIDGYPVGEYCFLMDWPEVKDPPRYRDVCQGDVGREVQVREQGEEDWTDGKLVGIDDGIPVVATDYGYHGWDETRILDDGQPKREPREITLYSRNGHIGVVQLDDDCEAILFREVVE